MNRHIQNIHIKLTFKDEIALTAYQTYAWRGMVHLWECRINEQTVINIMHVMVVFVLLLLLLLLRLAVIIGYQ